MNQPANTLSVESETRWSPPQDPAAAPAWLEKTLHLAMARHVTDLHFFPDETEARLWLRIDGELSEVARYSSQVHKRLLARLKVLARCADYDGPPVQEGRIVLNPSSGDQARLSIIPTLHGLKAAIRLLPGRPEMRRLEQLGFASPLIQALRQTLAQPQGLILAIGPSGSGKSTSLYALLQSLAEQSTRPRSILTIEDPVEQSLPFAAQVSADPQRGLGFAEGLRALLRQDPEVIMIGEIRDDQTAAIALQAALTGHQLLSSMHTLTPADALVRLAQMGVPPYVIASAITGILNVRLVRLLCPECSRLRPLRPDERRQFPELVDTDTEIQDAEGCEACLGSGHRGRTGLGEWVEPTLRTPAMLSPPQPALEIARTLRITVGARQAFVEGLAQGRLSPSEQTRLTGLISLNGAVTE